MSDTTNTKDGGPAFPQTSCDDSGNTWTDSTMRGLSIRDYFAALAMQGIVANLRSDLERPLAEHAEVIAENGYALADAMLKARPS